MTKSSNSNTAKGRESFDVTIGNSLVSFLNRNVTPYPTEIGSPNFSLVPVTEQKDVMINVARMHAEQEYNRIMALVEVLQNQAKNIRRRLELTDMVHKAEYNFKPINGNIYWLVYEINKNRTILTQTGPNDWCTGVPEHYEYLIRIKWLGDYTWIEVDNEGNELQE